MMIRESSERAAKAPRSWTSVICELTSEKRSCQASVMVLHCGIKF